GGASKATRAVGVSAKRSTQLSARRTDCPGPRSRLLARGPIPGWNCASCTGLPPAGLLPAPVGPGNPSCARAAGIAATAAASVSRKRTRMGILHRRLLVREPGLPVRHPLDFNSWLDVALLARAPLAPQHRGHALSNHPWNPSWRNR